MRVTLSLLVCLLAMLVACAMPSKYRAGDYIKPIGSNETEAVLKIVAVHKDSYRVWTHSQDGARLILRKDSLDLSRAAVDREYERATPPKIDGTFSIDEGFKESAR